MHGKILYSRRSQNMMKTLPHPHNIDKIHIFHLIHVNTRVSPCPGELGKLLGHGAQDII